MLKHENIVELFDCLVCLNGLVQDWRNLALVHLAACFLQETPKAFCLVMEVSCKKMLKVFYLISVRENIMIFLVLQRGRSGGLLDL